MMSLEDQFHDILNKAKRGLNLSDHDLIKKTGLRETDIQSLCNGQLTDTNHLKKMAQVLSLDAESLLAIAQDFWQPQSVHVEGLQQFQSAWGDMTVNTYLLHNQTTAIAFDTGTDAQAMLDFIKKHHLQLESLFITHTHGDHIFELDRIREATQAQTWVCEKENISGAQTFEAGHLFSFGTWKIETLLTPGHSPGGTTYVVKDIKQPLAFVGDALFAGSMGSVAAPYYQSAQENIRNKILTLPDSTILCPGHGPVTTVGEEKNHNPFFASFFKS
ncbi:MAG: MBL fold metallo-hydrolase [Verrucomicrobiae bacterium]|nr:MBL fold metallo-hydrolase [Verrucomicrobiae bacterium]